MLPSAAPEGPRLGGLPGGRLSGGFLTMTGGDFMGVPSLPLGAAGFGGGLTGHPSSPRATAGRGVAAEADQSRLGPSPPAGLAGRLSSSAVSDLGLGLREARSGPASLTGGRSSSEPISRSSSPSCNPGKSSGPGTRVLSAHPSWNLRRSVVRVGPGQAPPATVFGPWPHFAFHSLLTNNQYMSKIITSNRCS